MHRTHPLTLWLVINGVRRKEFAQDVGIGQPYLSELISGRKRPTLSVADRISTATGGAITAQHFPGDRCAGAQSRSE
jgi:transcriptional regulator with XRE-family HTH domain